VVLSKRWRSRPKPSLDETPAIKSRVAAVTVLAFPAADRNASAQDAGDPFALSLEQLFDVTVSVSRMPEKLGDTPAGVYVLTSEDITRSGATSIANALRLVGQWGANAPDRVINIITKKAVDTKGLLLSTIGRTWEQPVVTMHYGGDTGSNARWRVYGRYLNRPSDNALSGIDAEDGWEASRGGFRVDGDRNAQRDSFTLQGHLYPCDSRPEFNALRGVNATRIGRSVYGRLVWRR
jgi:outer membrane cobalamin receptor